MIQRGSQPETRETGHLGDIQMGGGRTPEAMPLREGCGFPPAPPRFLFGDPRGRDVMECLQVEPERDALGGLIRSTHAFSEGNFTLSSGKSSDHYFDLKLLGGDSRGLHTAASVLYGRICEMDGIKSVGGLESGSISFASAISQLSYLENKNNSSKPQISSFFVRKDRKEHGTKKKVEGKIDGPVVVIDDVVTTGSSALKAIKSLRNEGHECSTLLCIIFRGTDKDLENIEKVVKLQPIFKGREFTHPETRSA